MQDNAPRAPQKTHSAGKRVQGSRTGRAASGKRLFAKPGLTPKKIAWRVGLSVLTAVALVLVAAIGAGFIGFRGPSRSLGDLLTVSMLETSALKFVPRDRKSVV